MKYSKFEIKNFKGIKHVILDLDKEPKSKVFTLIGLNESGKTSILEAISFFQEDLAIKERHKLIPKSEKIDFSDKVSVSVKLILDALDNEELRTFTKSLGYKQFENISSINVTKSYEFLNSNFVEKHTNWSISLKGLKKGAVNLKDIPHKDDVDSDWQKIVAFIKKELIPSILYYPNFLFDFPDKIYLAETSGNNTIEQSTYRGVIQDILYSIGEKLTIEDHLLKRMKNDTTSNKEALEQTLARMSSTVTRIVFNAWAKLFNSTGKEIVIKSGSEIVSGETRYYLEFKLKENSSQFNITERSLGFKWFFSFLLFTEFRKNRVTDSGEILFLLDEPASNLHSTAQKNLLNTFSEIINKSTLIYTTHSHHLINPDWLNGAYIVRNKGLDYSDDFTFDSNQTDVEATLYKQFVVKHPNQRDYYQPILDTLEYQPGLLEKIESIVIVEGKNDFYTFTYLNSVYFKNKFDKVRIYPGGGATANVVVIRLYLAWGRRFLILLDGDGAGEKAKKEYIKIFGPIIEPYIYTYIDIDKSFKDKSTEQLFNTNDLLLITQYFDNKAKVYEKSKFNTGIQSLKQENKKLTLSKNTLENFTKVFSFIEKQL